VVQAGPARLDTEIEKYFDMSVVLLPVAEALNGIGTSITSMNASRTSVATRSASSLSGAPPGVENAGLAQFGPQPGNQCLQRIAGITGRVVGPELPGQRAGRDDTPGVQGEQSEQDPELAPADVDRTPRLVPHLKRA